MNTNLKAPINKLGFGDNKVQTPDSMEGVIGLLAKLMAAAINNQVEPESAKLALNAATRIVEAQQADTRMKALAIAANRTIERANGWALISVEPKELATEQEAAK